jgi:hypothetical protein
MQIGDLHDFGPTPKRVTFGSKTVKSAPKVLQKLVKKLESHLTSILTEMTLFGSDFGSDPGTRMSFWTPFLGNSQKKTIYSGFEFQCT